LGVWGFSGVEGTEGRAGLPSALTAGSYPQTCPPKLAPKTRAAAQIINKAIAAELIFLATANLDNALYAEGW
jgi:hypothetical protein